MAPLPAIAAKSFTMQHTDGTTTTTAPGSGIGSEGSGSVGTGDDVMVRENDAFAAELIESRKQGQRAILSCRRDVCDAYLQALRRRLVSP